MKKVIIIRYAELYLKKKNRGYFETIFENNIKKALDGLAFEFHKNSGRYIIDGFCDEDMFIALALLPQGVDVGTKLHYELFEYSIIN